MTPFIYVLLELNPGLILENKGMHAVVQEKGKEMLRKGKIGQNIWKFGQNCTKSEYILKKGRWFCAGGGQVVLLSVSTFHFYISRY